MQHCQREFPASIFDAGLDLTCSEVLYFSDEENDEGQEEEYVHAIRCVPYDVIKSVLPDRYRRALLRQELHQRLTPRGLTPSTPTAENWCDHPPFMLGIALPVMHDSSYTAEDSETPVMQNIIFDGNECVEMSLECIKPSSSCLERSFDMGNALYLNDPAAPGERANRLGHIVIDL